MNKQQLELLKRINAKEQAKKEFFKRFYANLKVAK